MNTHPAHPRPLDHFESALLTELREHVATRPAPEVVADPPRRHRRRWAVGVAVAAAAATAVVIASPGGPGASPAYAVSESADGDVVVTIHRIEDSAGLEAALREHGIDADVSFQPSPAEEDGIITYKFPDGIAEEVPEGGELSYEFEAEDEGGGRVDQAEPADGQVTDLPDCGGGVGEPATLTHQGDDWVLRIPADSPAQDRPIMISTASDGALMVAFEADTPGAYCAFMSVGS